MLRTTIFLSFGLVSAALAQGGMNYQCSLGGDIRRVEIMYETGVAVPCEVHYLKVTEAPGTREVLWSAQNESGYCEARSEEFVARLESLGWACSAQASNVSEDDTAVLESASDDAAD
jgi:hypothetical protein